MQKKNIVVVGAGPAGMMAAIRARQHGHHVVLLEKNPSPGRKLLLSGKGRCNLTNAGDLDASLARFSSGGQFLRDAFKVFFNQELMQFFQSRGLRLKVERQQRVFPATDSSASVLKVLMDELKKLNVVLVCNAKVEGIIIENNTVTGVRLPRGNSRPADCLILATGGLSYAFTGSTGDGIRWSQELQHRVQQGRPGLVPLEVVQAYPRQLEGLTLKNISLIFTSGRHKVVSEVGELMFTKNGISGPLVFTLSGMVADWLAAQGKVMVAIDLKPGLSDEQLDARLLRDFKDNAKKSIKNAFKGLVPLRLIDVFLAMLQIDPEKKASQITLQERREIRLLLKGFSMEIARTLPLEEAMVTKGGVSLKDINPRTMESRLVKGLYFAGEMIDVDADTGGFNLQAAFSTGYLAGQSASIG